MVVVTTIMVAIRGNLRVYSGTRAEASQSKTLTHKSSMHNNWCRLRITITIGFKCQMANIGHLFSIQLVPKNLYQDKRSPWISNIHPFPNSQIKTTLRSIIHRTKDRFCHREPKIKLC